MTLQELEQQYPGLKEYSRNDFTNNECGSDEYRETQPSKGLMMLADMFDDGGFMNSEQYAEGLTLMAAWMTRMANPQPEDYSYAGAEELVPLLAMYHDLLWDHGQHPYDGLPDDLWWNDERLQEFLDDTRADASA